MANETWRAYLKLLDDVSGTMAQLTEIEQEKTAAASRGDLAVIDSCMKREQALSMTLRGFDQKREKLLGELGLAGVPLRELTDHSPEGLERETKRTAEELRRQYTLFQAASKVARNTLECNLRAIEKMRQELEAEAPDAELPRQSDFRA